MQGLLDGTVVLLLAGGKGERLLPLTEQRPKPMVPFGGKYRIIDFVLSNCLHSNLNKIYVLSRYEPYSLNRHLSLGWNIFNSERDEFLRVLLPRPAKDSSDFPGTAGEIYQNIQSLRGDNPRYIVVLSGDQIYQMDYRNLLQFHLERKAILTIGAVEVNRETAKRSGVLAINRKMEVVRFKEKPTDPKPLPGQKERFLASMGIYVFNFEDIVDALEIDMANEGSNHDFGRDVIPEMLKNGKRIVAFPFCDEATGQTAYWQDVGTIESYFNANMGLLEVVPTLDLYRKDWPLRTRPRQLPPTKIVFHESIERSIFGEGCIIDEGGIGNSILGSGVQVGKGAQIISSILMDNVVIGEGSRVVRAIIDESNIIPSGSIIEAGNMRYEGRYVIDPSGIVVVPIQIF
ncbi:MAG: sugar phosphate nucleotidyltransferase [bacterium]|nr:sugar phosphate nucleotidyltransferase [bacterium]